MYVKDLYQLLTNREIIKIPGQGIPISELENVPVEDDNSCHFLFVSLK